MADFFDHMQSLQNRPLYERHPHFDSYPTYLQDALIANERLQGRMK